MLRFISFIFAIYTLGYSSLYAESLETRFRTMVDEVKAALDNEKKANNKAVEKIIQRYANMDAICTYVAASYLRQETSGMDLAAKKVYIANFLETFKPVYTAYLARTWTSENNAKTFKDFTLVECTVKGKTVDMQFKDSTDKPSYIVLELDDKNLIRSIKFGERQNLVDPISADRGSCESGVSQGKKPQDIFSGKKDS